MSREVVLEKIEELGRAHALFAKSYDDRLDALETRQARVRALRANVAPSETLDDHPELLRYLRTGDMSGLHRKDMSVGGTDAGAAFVPQFLDRRIVERMIDLFPLVGQVLFSQRATSSDISIPVNIRGSTTAWVSETGARDIQTSPTIKAVVPPHGGLYSVLKVTNWLLQDSFVSLEAYLVNEIAAELAVAVETAIVSGDGSNKPLGFLDGTPVSTGDYDSPARTFGVLQYVPTGKAGAFANSRVDSPPGDPADALLNLIKALRTPYRRNARWLMNRGTLNTIAKFKDADGKYLATPGLGGEPDRLMGYPVMLSEAMPDVASNTFPVCFGDFNQAYRLFQIGEPMLVRDPYTARGFTHLYYEDRFAGKLVDDHALKLLKAAVS